MANQDLPLVPEHAPGDGVAEVLKRIALHVRADRLDAADFTGDLTIELFNIPADTLIVDVYAWVSEAFTASSTLEIGDGDDTNRYLDAAALVVTTAGWKSAKQDASPGSGAYLYSTANTIDVLSDGATPTAGTLDVYVSYILNHNLNLIVAP